MATTRKAPDDVGIARGARPWRRRPRAAAARQALRLCEADQARFTWNRSSPPNDPARIPGTQGHNSASTTRAALRAVGVPPIAAAALPRRLRLTPEQQAEQ